MDFGVVLRHVIVAHTDPVELHHLSRGLNLDRCAGVGENDVRASLDGFEREVIPNLACIGQDYLDANVGISGRRCGLVAAVRGDQRAAVDVNLKSGLG